MPLTDYRCLTCGHEFEFNRPLSMYPATPPCPTCNAATEQYHPPPRTNWTIDPVVVYRDHDGSFRFPGDPNGAGAAKYSAQGMERIELRSAADVRRFESQMNKREYSRACRRVEAAHAARQARESNTRAEIRRGLEQGFQIPELDRDGRRTGRTQTVRLSERGRAIMQAAIRRNEDKPRLRASESGFHVDVYSNDRSNRDESRDAQGRRRRD